MQLTHTGTSFAQQARCAGSRRATQSSARPVAVQRLVRCAATNSDQQQQQQQALDANRRGVLLSLAATAVLARAPASLADDEFKTFYGLATPPTSYGGYGGNANELPKYSFDHPATWKSDTINKVDKGTQGIDSRVYNPRNKAEQVFVITLSRAGEDGGSFALRDIESTFAGFAGADYGLQDALSYSTEKTQDKRDIGGQLFYDVGVIAPDVAYQSTITVSRGKVYAMFVKAPIKAYNAEPAKYRRIVDSFRLLNQDE